MKRIILSILISSSVLLFSQDCSDLFFSEYVEGSGNNKALEIYNPTDHIINLSEYWVTRYSNGSPVYNNGGATKLEGFILPYSTFILVNGQTEDTELPGGGTSPKCDQALQELATVTHNGMLDGDYLAPTYMNGNDAIALFRDPEGKGNYNDFIATDLFGAIADGMQSEDEGWAPFTQKWVYRNIYDEDKNLIGRDSAFIRKYIVPEGYYWIPWTSGHSLYRKSSVKKGVTALVDSFNVTLEWDTVPGKEDVWDYLGSHICECDPALFAKSFTEKGELFVFPNPTMNEMITLYTTENILWAGIYNITGQLIFTEIINGKTGRLTLLLNYPPPGIYLLKAYTDERKAYTRKFIIR